jgi:hypothetical protein
MGPTFFPSPVTARRALGSTRGLAKACRSTSSGGVHGKPFQEPSRRCGARAVNTSPEWRAHKAQGAGHKRGQ